MSTPSQFQLVIESNEIWQWIHNIQSNPKLLSRTFHSFTSPRSDNRICILRCRKREVMLFRHEAGILHEVPLPAQLTGNVGAAEMACLRVAACIYVGRIQRPSHVTWRGSLSEEGGISSDFPAFPNSNNMISGRAWKPSKNAAGACYSNKIYDLFHKSYTFRSKPLRRHPTPFVRSFSQKLTPKYNTNRRKERESR